MAPKKSFLRQLADLDVAAAPDFDPEGEAREQERSSSDSDSDNDSRESHEAGTEHYVTVSQSKLRQKEPVSLGPRYRGARISRAALEASSRGGRLDDGGESSDGESNEDEDNGVEDASDSDDYDDPDKADLEADHIDEDAEIDSDEAFGESDEEKFKGFVFRGSSRPTVDNGKRSRRPTAADFLSSSEDEMSDATGVDDGGEDGSEASNDYSDLGENGLSGALLSEDDDISGEEGESEGDSAEDNHSGEADGGRDAQRAELRKIMSEGRKSIVSSMSQAAKADVEKGAAVRQQRRTFDSLLNIRIRLQKALVAANSLDAVATPRDAIDAPYRAAEEAAIKLLETMADVRDSLLLPGAQANAGQKRKPSIQVDTSNQLIWEGMQSTEAVAAAKRRKVLDKWSNRVKSTTAPATTRKLGGAPSQALVSVLDDQLVNTDRLIKRSQVPRSCAPLQAAKKVDGDPNIYDDADFYQVLLKELVDQRTGDTSAPGGSVATVRWAAIKEAKTRKQVDRKASKGRKLRYNVHEKLQNFMAPEDRRAWEQDAIDRFFGSLFGQKMELNEDEASDEDTGGVSLEEEGLRLFRG